MNDVKAFLIDELIKHVIIASRCDKFIDALIILKREHERICITLFLSRI